MYHDEGDYNKCIALGADLTLLDSDQVHRILYIYMKHEFESRDHSIPE